MQPATKAWSATSPKAPYTDQTQEYGCISEATLGRKN